MAQKMTTDQLKTAFTFPFQEEKWVGKLAVATLLVFLVFIPLVPQILLAGYMALLILQVVEEDKLSLPVWDNLGEIFSHGARLFGVGLFYLLPVLLLFVVGYLVMILPTFALEMDLGSDGVWIVSVVVGMMMMGLGGVLSFVMGIFIPVAGTHAVVSRDFRAGFRIREWWQIFRANWDGFLVAFLLVFGGGMLGYYASQVLVLTVVLCCLYPFVTGALGAYLMIVGSVLFAQAYRDGRAAVGDNSG